MPKIVRPDASDPDTKRVELADALAAIALSEGLQTFGLRRLAARLGTSDRMLLYYFGTKDALVLAMLDRVGVLLDRILLAESGGPLLSPGAFLQRVLALSGDPAVAPFMRLWTEVIARGARGETPYDRVGPEVVRSWYAWIDTRLLPPENSAREGRAAAILAIVEGINLLELAAPGSTRGAGAILSAGLDAIGPKNPSRQQHRA